MSMSLPTFQSIFHSITDMFSSNHVQMRFLSDKIICKEVIIRRAISTFNAKHLNEVNFPSRTHYFSAQVDIINFRKPISLLPQYFFPLITTGLPPKTTNINRKQLTIFETAIKTKFDFAPALHFTAALALLNPQFFKFANHTKYARE